MLRVRSQALSFGLGAAEQKLYREVGDCGIVHGGDFFFGGSSGRPCRSWTASEIPLRAGDPVYATDLRRQITYYPTPDSVVEKLGRCGALQAGYTTGFLVPGASGTEQVEPGVYHPSKSWQEMVDESRKLRANDPSIQTAFRFCGEFVIESSASWETQVRPPTNQSDSWSWNLTLKNSNGSTKCESPEVKNAEGIIVSWTARLPPQYQTTLPVLRTAAMWLASDSDSWTSKRGIPGTDQMRPVGPFIQQVICGSEPIVAQASEWGHRYDTRTFSIAQVGPSGPAATAMRTLEGPILQVYVNPNVGPAKAMATTWVGIWTGALTGNILAASIAGMTVGALVESASEGQWVNLTPSQVKRAVGTGQWPLPGTLRVRWKDTGEEFDPRTVPLVPSAGPQKAGMGGVALGLAGLALGVGLIIYARRK